MKNIKVHLITGKEVSFIGTYREDLQKENWHYYETETKKIIHFRKEHIVMVVEG